MRNSQLKFYTSFLKKGEYLLLKSKDAYFKSHYISSPLNVLTNFSGTAGEAVVDYSGKITIFVDTRYHILVEKQVFKDIEIYKMPLNESFLDSLKKKFKKDTVLYVPSDIDLTEYIKYDEYFDLRTYKLKDKYLKNSELNTSSPVFLADKKTERHDFSYKIQKLSNLKPNIKKRLIFNLDYIAYLTNLRSFQMKHSSLFRSILYLDFETKKHILFLDKIPDIKIKNLNFMRLEDFPNFIQSIKKVIYLDYKDVTLSDFVAIKKPKEIKKDNLSLLSSIKSLSEINYIKECSAKLDTAIFNFKNKIKAGMSEHDLACIFEEELKSTGSVFPSFSTILALDDNSASIHYTNADKNKILKKESLILLDCGGYWKNGFATDITRTFYFGKNPKPIYKKIYTYVLKAFIACFLSKEKSACKLDSLARKILKPFEKDGFYFNHGLGHGIGTSVHQNPPVLNLVSKDIIKSYQVHSIEPGLYGGYNEKFGVRIENCVYFDLNYKRFSVSKFPFEEVLIEYGYLDNQEIEFIKNWQKGFKI